MKDETWTYQNKPVGDNWPVNFDEKTGLIDKISHMQRRIILYSIMYYELDSPVVNDFYNDACGYQLVYLMGKCNISDLDKTDYWYCMYDYDGSTGFYIRDRLNEHDKEYLTHLAWYIVKSNQADANKYC